MAFIWAGLVLTLLGIGCAVEALGRVWRGNSDGPMWPWIGRTGNLLWRQVYRLMPWRRRRHRRVVTGVLNAALPGLTGSARGTVTGPQIPEDAPLDEQIRLLVRRVQRIEENAAQVRSEHDNDVAAIREEVRTLAVRLDRADQELKMHARATAIGTLRLQVVGLGLVGLGTVLMAIPTLVWGAPT